MPWSSQTRRNGPFSHRKSGLLTKDLDYRPVVIQKTEKQSDASDLMERLGILGAIGSTATFVGTVTIIPFMPNGWDPVAGFPAMAGNVPGAGLS